MRDNANLRDRAHSTLSSDGAGRRVFITLLVGMLCLSGAAPVIQLGAVTLDTGAVGQASAQSSPGEEVWNFTEGSVATGPVVADGVVYTTTNAGFLYALDNSTGDILWNTTVGGTSPQIELRDETLYVGGDDFHAINAADGSEEWNVSTPTTNRLKTVGDNAVVLSSGTAYGIKLTNQTQTWSFTVDHGNANGVDIYNGTAVVAGGEETYGLDVVDGSEQWRVDMASIVLNVAPVIDNGTAYVGSEEPQVYAIDVSTGTVEWSQGVPDNRVGSPVTVADGKVFYTSSEGGGGTIGALNATTGNGVWSTGTPIRAGSAPTYAGGNIYSTTWFDASSELYSLNATDGAVEWTAATNEDFISGQFGATVESGTIFNPISSGGLEAITSNHSEDSSGARVTRAVLGGVGSGVGLTQISGRVINSSEVGVSNATVTVRNATNTSKKITNTTTNSTGYWDVTVSNGSYNLSAEKPNYTTDYTNVTVNGSDVTGVLLTINEYDIRFDVRGYLQPGQTVPYRVYVLGENVSANSTVNSSDTSVVTVDMANLTVSAVDDRRLNATVTVTANYTTAENTTLNASKNITVAALTVENMEILPSNSWRFAALFNRAPGDDAPLDADPKRFNFLFFLLLGTLIAVPMARFTSAFGGLAMAELVIVMGWFAGYLSFGMAAVSVFVALFIGLNLAANIDYQAGGIRR